MGANDLSLTWVNFKTNFRKMNIYGQALDMEIRPKLETVIFTHHAF